MNSNLINFYLSRIKSISEVHIAFPEIDDRISHAGSILSDMGLKISYAKSINSSDKHVQMLKNLSFSKNWPDQNLIDYLDDKFITALAMLKNDEIDGVICGCTMPTSDVIRNAIRIVGLKKSTKWLSSTFLMSNPKSEEILAFSDCAVIPEPTPEQLSDIAEKTSITYEMLTGKDPRVAFLSFSTKGSADHYRVANVRKAVKRFAHRNPDIMHEGEIQLDAAINSSVSDKKINKSQLKGTANILIFPNLDAGNIGYKLVQKFGNHFACGPLLLGLDLPVNDLSRGASVDDIVLIGLITAIQAERGKSANI